MTWTPSICLVVLAIVGAVDLTLGFRRRFIIGRVHVQLPVGGGWMDDVRAP